MAVLRKKYAKKITAQNNRLEREKKFAESLEDGEDPVNKLISDHLKRVNNKDIVKVRVDRKTMIYVDRNKCVQLEDGTWIKKQNDNT